MHIFTVGKLKEMIEAYPDDMPICGFNVRSGRKCDPVSFHVNECHKHDTRRLNRIFSLKNSKQSTLVVYIN